MQHFNVEYVSIRDNFYTTERAMKNFTSSIFYKETLVMKGNHLLVDSRGNVMCRLLENFIPHNLITQLENSAKRCEHLALTRYTEDKQGPHICVRMGSVVERGGTGAIRKSSNNEEFSGFLADNKELFKFLSNFLEVFDPEAAKLIKRVPTEHRIFGNFTVGFWNVTNISKLHRDNRDFRWCFVIPFVENTSANLDLPVLNATVCLKRGDLCVVPSKDLFHSVSNVVGKRQVIVLTSHTALIRRYCDVDTLYSY